MTNTTWTESFVLCSTRLLRGQNSCGWGLGSSRRGLPTILSVGLDVHARTIVGCMIDERTGEVVHRRFGYDLAEVPLGHSASSHSAGREPSPFRGRSRFAGLTRSSMNRDFIEASVLFGVDFVPCRQVTWCRDDRPAARTRSFRELVLYVSRGDDVGVFSGDDGF